MEWKQPVEWGHGEYGMKEVGCERKRDMGEWNNGVRAHEREE